MKRLIRSFRYAFQGIFRTVWEERNFRIHLTAVFFVSWLAVLYGVSPLEAAVLVLVFFNVLALELVNTAVENAVDHGSLKTSPYALRAKDASAGAVLLAAVSAVTVAVLMFRDGEKWAAVRDKVFSLPRGAFVLIAVVLAVLFVFGFGTKKRPAPDRENENL